MASLIYGLRTLVVGNSKWKPVELPLTRKIVSQNQHHIPGWITEISVSKSKVVILTRSPFDSPIWPMQKADRSWRMILDYHKLKQVVNPNKPPVTDLALLLEQINTSSAILYCNFWCGKRFFFFLIPVSNDQEKQFSLCLWGQKYAFTVLPRCYIDPPGLVMI